MSNAMGNIREFLGITEVDYQEMQEEAQWDFANLVEAHTESSPIPEVSTEVWNDPNSLLMFCMGVFEQWEIKAIEQQCAKWNQVDLLLNLRGMLRSHFHRKHR